MHSHSRGIESCDWAVANGRVHFMRLHYVDIDGNFHSQHVSRYIYCYENDFINRVIVSNNVGHLHDDIYDAR